MNTIGQILMVMLVVLLVVGAIYGVAQAVFTQDFQFSGIAGGGEWNEGEFGEDDDENESGDDDEDDD